MKTALISVSDKTGLKELGRALIRAKWRIVSTGGTAAFLKKQGVAVVAVEEITGFPEILDGRVKTLHPHIFAGLLATKKSSHTAQLKKHGICRIDMVCVNLYPFEETRDKKNASKKDVIEQIDIGGPSLIRAAAKNGDSCLVLCEPAQYSEAIQLLSKKNIPADFRKRCVATAFAHTARYDAAIADFFGRSSTAAGLEVTPGPLLRYGENPHQKAELFVDKKKNVGSITGATVLSGKQLSYNNFVDATVAWQAACDFLRPAAAVIKHACPCGIAEKSTVELAIKEALAADKKSPFGGIVAVNRPLTAAAAMALMNTFLEVIIAPTFSPGAKKMLMQKKNMRLLETGALLTKGQKECRSISGGLLVQESDDASISTMQVVTKNQPTAVQKRDALFAAKAVKHVRSNAIVLAKNGVTVGIGGGQTARVDAVDIAISKAGSLVSGCVMASDAFFPFTDSVEKAAKAGVSCIIHPGGSIRDSQVVAAADFASISIITTGQRSFRH